MSVFGPDVVLDRVAYLDPTARLFGAVSVGEGASVWPYAVIRAEQYEVRIGRFSNVQDHVMIHIGYHAPTLIGDYCTIAHHVALHGCTIGDQCLVGLNATIMDGCVIGAGSIVAGGTFLKEGTVIPENSIVAGVPGVVKARRDNFVANRLNAMLYWHNALAYAAGDYRAWTGPAVEAFMADQRTAIEAEHAARRGTA